VGGTSGLWVAVGGVCGLLLVGFVHLTYVCAVFCGTVVLATIIIMRVAKEEPLPKDAEILLPLRRAKTPGQKVWFSIKDFFTSFLFSIKRFPDFFLLLLQRAMTALGSIPQTYLQYFLNDILCVSEPQTYASLMMMIILLVTLFGSPIFGMIADKYKRPRLLMIAGTFITIASMSVFVWGNSIYFFLFLQTALSGIGSAAITSSSMPVTLAVMPSRKKAAQFFAEFTLFETISTMFGNQGFGILLEQFNILKKGSSGSSSSSSSSSWFSSSNESYTFSSSSPTCGPQTYSKLGYDVEFSAAMGILLISVILLLCINTGRGRRAQEEYDEELRRAKATEEPLLDVAEDQTPSGVVPINDK